MKSTLFRPLLVAMLCVVGAPAAAAAQDAWDDGIAAATRPRLEELVVRYERAAESTAYSSVLRDEAAEQAQRLEERLEQGDFRPGDNVYVRVERQQELTDTFTVTPDRVLDVPVVGDIPLQGVLRSELQARVQESVARVIRDPRVAVRSLLRLSFTGAVVRPGFHTVDAQALFSDALMSAGGPAPGAELDEIRVERGGETLLEPEVVQEALQRGWTLDELGLRDGDRIEVPAPSEGGLAGDLRDWLYIIPSVVGLAGLLF